MPPQIKQDLNRSGWETTDFPSVCESCLPENPYVQMMKQDHALECKLCTRPFSVFTWKPDRTSRTKRTIICLTCSRTRNCCQSCLLDLSFGLPITVRDAALKLSGSAPNSSINREYFAQNNEKAVEEGVGLEDDKQDEKGRELLRKLAQSEPYHQKKRKLNALEGDKGGSEMSAADDGTRLGQGNLRSSGNRPASRLSKGRDSRARPMDKPFSAQPSDWVPPRDKNILSLFVTGVEDDLPEHAIRTFFTPFGTIRSIVCSHRSHCAFINYATRTGAEAAAKHCHGRAIIRGVPLRVIWSKPKALDHLDTEERMAYARSGRETVSANAQPQITGLHGTFVAGEGHLGDSEAVAAPPGEANVPYASLEGN